MLANKRDLPNCMSIEDIGQVLSSSLRHKYSPGHDSFQALSLAEIQTHPSKIFACSAVTGENVQEGLAWLVHDIGDKRYHFD